MQTRPSGKSSSAAAQISRNARRPVLPRKPSSPKNTHSIPLGGGLWASCRCSGIRAPTDCRCSGSSERRGSVGSPAPLSLLQEDSCVLNCTGEIPSTGPPKSCARRGGGSRARMISIGPSHLFVAQGHHRIDSRGPPCGEPTRQQGHGNHSSGNSREDHRIVGADVTNQIG